MYSHYNASFLFMQNILTQKTLQIVFNMNYNLFGLLAIQIYYLKPLMLLRFIWPCIRIIILFGRSDRRL